MDGKEGAAGGWGEDRVVRPPVGTGGQRWGLSRLRGLRIEMVYEGRCAKWEARWLYLLGKKCTGKGAEVTMGKEEKVQKHKEEKQEMEEPNDEDQVDHDQNKEGHEKDQVGDQGKIGI